MNLGLLCFVLLRMLPSMRNTSSGLSYRTEWAHLQDSSYICADAGPRLPRSLVVFFGIALTLESNEPIPEPRN